MKYINTILLFICVILLAYIIGSDYQDFGVVRGTPRTGFSLIAGEQISIGSTTANGLMNIYQAADDADFSFVTATTTLSGTTTRHDWILGLDYSDASKFKISSSTVLGTSDQLVVDGYGNIGILTSSPEYTLDMYKSGTTTIRMDGFGSCLILKDYDNLGYTYCNYLDGVQTCSSTNICF